MPQRSDLQMRDTPALAILRDNPEAFAGVDGASLKAAQDILRASKRVLGSFADTFAEHDLSPGRYSVLMALHAAEALAPSEIAERLGVSRATVTGLITGLEKGGLARLSAGPDTDRRRKAVVLTEKGRDLLRRVVPVIFRQMTALVGGLDSDERTQLQTLLLKVERAATGQNELPPNKENDQ